MLFPSLFDLFQSTLPARGATLGRKKMANVMTHFNPRSPHGERQWSKLCNAVHRAFQSTLPARGATARRSAARAGWRYFNPRSPHGERRGNPAFRPSYRNFNPRSPHGERRHAWPRLPRHPISIHAPRTGSDRRTSSRRLPDSYFNPRSPHGERRGAAARSGGGFRHFNPRSPHGERRRASKSARARGAFQSTLPARGATTACLTVEFPGGDFNPRSPHGERPSDAVHSTTTKLFQSTLPARGATASRIGG